MQIMKISEERAYQLSLYGAIPLLSGIVSAAVVKWGHSFAIFAKTGLLYGGLFGAVQTLGAHVLNAIIIDYFPKGLLGFCASLVVSNLACGAIFCAISLIAFKAGIAAASLTFSAAAILVLGNCALALGLTLATPHLIHKLKEIQWIDY